MLHDRKSRSVPRSRNPFVQAVRALEAFAAWWLFDERPGDRNAPRHPSCRRSRAADPTVPPALANGKPVPLGAAARRRTLAVVGTDGLPGLLRVVRQAGWHVAGVFSDDRGDALSLHGLQPLGRINDLRPDATVVAAVRANRHRWELLQRLGEGCGHWPAIASPSAEIDPEARLGAGTVVGDGVSIGTNVLIGRHCRIGSECVIGDECVIDDYVTLEPGTRLGPRVTVGMGSLCEQNSTVLERICVGDWCRLRANSVLMDPLPSGSIAAGAPASVRKAARAA